MNSNPEIFVNEDVNAVQDALNRKIQHVIFLNKARKQIEVPRGAWQVYNWHQAKQLMWWIRKSTIRRRR